MPKRSLHIFNSDQINRAKMRVQSSALMEAEEDHLAYAMKHGLPRGLPVNLQHDLTRFVGWSTTLGHFIDGSMVRVVGILEQPETDAERAELKDVGRRYWEIHHAKGAEKLRAELSQRVVPELLDAQSTEFLRVETCVAVRDQLAARLYPDLFDPAQEHVDKDGLVDYEYLQTRVRVLAPGIFLEEGRQLLLFAHRFFRRSQAHVNKLNDYFLDSFSKAAKDKKLRARLRLDPDRIGHPDELKEILEFEYWHGPKYSEDIASIPSGVATYKADEGTRDLEGVDKTQVWWKAPEIRSGDAGAQGFRTLEIEELRDVPSLGLPGERYGCRYVHAEYSLDERCITHFDGAVRAYPAEKYLERIDLNIGRAGKHSEYTKLFRFDGKLEVALWKRLLSDYFRGNPLIPEYLGAPTNGLEGEMDAWSEEVESPDGSIDPTRLEEPLCAFIHLRPLRALRKFELVLRPLRLADGETTVPAMETGIGKVDELLRGQTDLSMVASMRRQDGELELVPMVFGGGDEFPQSMHALIAELVAALAVDISKLELQRIALTLIWPQGDLLTSLSIRGSSPTVLSLLSRLFTVVDASKPPSDWIEGLAREVRELSPQATASRDLHGVMGGVLSLERVGGDVELMFPKPLTEELRRTGVFKGV